MSPLGLRSGLTFAKRCIIHKLCFSYLVWDRVGVGVGGGVTTLRPATVASLSNGRPESGSPSEMLPKVARPPEVSVEPASLVEAISRAPVSLREALAASTWSEVSQWTDRRVPPSLTAPS